ncbi:PLP-dependent transferase [Ramicandelaber brevisporus]|nr:PLP-dependent transferase [Ramicandelaber brevisporus]
MTATTATNSLATVLQTRIFKPFLARLRANPAGTAGELVILYVLYGAISRLLRRLIGRGVLSTLKSLGNAATVRIIRLVRLLSPAADAKIQAEIDKSAKGIISHMIKDVEGEQRFLALPSEGMTQDELMQHLTRRQKEGTVEWEKGRVSGGIYHGGKELFDRALKAYEMFAFSNPLHPDVFPGLRRMEAEIVAMVLKMYNAHDKCEGCTTSGGTESIMLSVRAHLVYAKRYRGVTKPEMLVPVTAHSAFHKAAEYMNIELIPVPVDQHSQKADLAFIKRNISSQTIMLVGSAYGFPHGIIDDIVPLGRLAKQYNTGLHVDCCLGGFILPFMEKAGFTDLPLFDFRVPGVTAVSCDTHKYGFAPKGSSVIMYSSNKLRRCQYFVQADWTGGIYACPNITGSRPGALLAGCWAAMMTMGERGYVDSTRQIVTTARAIAATIRRDFPELHVIGDPLGSVVAFGSRSLNVMMVGDAMSYRGWSLNSMQNPPAVHIACTMLTIPVLDDFVRDLRSSVDEVVQHPERFNKGATAMYGVAGSIPDKSMIDEVAGAFVDALFMA